MARTYIFSPPKLSWRAEGKFTCTFTGTLLSNCLWEKDRRRPHVLVDFVVLRPGHGRSVTDSCGWDAHEAQLRCPDDVSGDIGGCSARRVLKTKFY